MVNFRVTYNYYKSYDLNRKENKTHKENPANKERIPSALFFYIILQKHPGRVCSQDESLNGDAGGHSGWYSFT
jgi:hypothetical protein